MFLSHIELALIVMAQALSRHSPARVVGARVTFHCHRAQLLLARTATAQEMIHQIRLLIALNAAAKDLFSQADRCPHAFVFFMCYNISVRTAYSDCQIFV